MDVTKLSPRLRSLHDKLVGGESVSRYDLHKCLGDDQAKLKIVRNEVSNLRKLLRPRGLDIVCEINPTGKHGIFYRMVRLMASPYDGKR